jgi:hypothetical protein
MVSGELVCATSLHFVPFAQEVTRAVIDMLIDSFIRRGKGAIGEVGGPTTEKAVQSHSHFRPRALLPGVNSTPIFVLIRCMLFLDGLAPRY